MQCKLTVIRLVSMMRFESKATCLANHVGFISCHIIPLVIYAPINNMPHYSPPGLCRGSGAFDFDFTPKLALYMGNLTTHHTYVQKCEH